MDNIYTVKVDFNKDGTYLSSYEDITSDIQNIHISYGRDEDMGRAQPAEIRITVADPNGKYIPGNLSSVIVNTYGNIYPGCGVQIDALLSGTTYRLYTATLDDVLPEPDKSRKKASLPCVDGQDYLVRTPISTPLTENAYAGGTSGLINLILNQAGWPAAKRVIATRNLDQYPAFFVDQTPALDVTQDIEKSEGAFGYIGISGEFNWEDRYTRLMDTRCTSSQWTCTKSKHVKVEPLYSLKSVINDIVITVQPRTKQASSIIWELADNASNSNSPIIYPGQTKEYIAEFAASGGQTNIAGDVQVVASGYYAGNTQAGGGGSDRTSGYLSVSTTIFAASAKLQVKNIGSSPVYLTQLQVEGRPYVDDAPLRIQQQDSSSQLAYRRSPYPSINLPYYQNVTVAQSWAQYLIATKKEPIPRYKVTLRNADGEIWQQMLARKVSDRIGLQNSDYNISGEFYIEKVTHDITECGKWHETEWIVSRADNQQYWVWDTSRWNSTTIWGY